MLYAHYVLPSSPTPVTMPLAIVSLKGLDIPEPFLARPLSLPVFCIVPPIVPVPAIVLPVVAV